jgi:hypothetical protein
MENFELDVFDVDLLEIPELEADEDVSDFLEGAYNE